MKTYIAPQYGTKQVDHHMTYTEKQRFAFGENWLNFLRVLSDEHIHEAEKSLSSFLNTSELKGKHFLDIGSGSGLHSLAARKMGAIVHAFDYDLQSVACTEELKRRYFPNDANWTIQQGSILDGKFVDGLGQFDVGYAWGVLHHTGALWQALYNAQRAVRKDGLLFVAIYNDQGLVSTVWKIIKRFYSSGWVGRVTMSLVFYPLFFLSGLLLDLIHLQDPTRRYREHKKYRGMSLVHDWRDWLGGYPFEPAEPAKIIGFCENLGFELVRFEPTGHGFGNNQFLFRKTGASPSGS
ncbi:MAG TPA: class I SAM-dependent methyltransferase [Anaerolineales bacterium]|nr:class I SAM-dependent methyltransferase [Anaerolineales bacterium]